jgi:hypothetical protein
VRLFNPGLLADGDGWLFAFRVVAADSLRRIALARLDRQLRPIAGSAIALSDSFRLPPGRDYPAQVRVWFADPRLYRLGGRLFVYWNSGWHEPQNAQFLHELDPATLRPVGVAREMLLRGAPRRPLEKNWMLFGEGSFHATYSPAPHRVLAFTLEGDGDIAFSDTATTAWDSPSLRGGAPPQHHAGSYWSFCHTIETELAGYRYAARVYRFAATAPFAPTHEPAGELDLGWRDGNRRLHPSLNPAIDQVIYPCGAAHAGDCWLVSLGINDERCAIAKLSDGEVARALRPIGGAA